MMSTAIPGSGQIWVEKKYPGYGFLGTEATLGLAALIAYYKYNGAWSGFEKNYNAYQDGTDPHDLYELRSKIVKYAEDTRRYNIFMKNIRGVAASIWMVNMIHAYLVAPADDYFDGESLFDIQYKECLIYTCIIYQIYKVIKVKEEHGLWLQYIFPQYLQESQSYCMG